MIDAAYGIDIVCAMTYSFFDGSVVRYRQLTRL
jgi:hypothetical protein